MADEPRPQRKCDSCGITDDHPRHVIGKTSSKHYDCCAADGCEHCINFEAEIGGGRRGQELIDHLAALRVARLAAQEQAEAEAQAQEGVTNG